MDVRGSEQAVSTSSSKLYHPSSLHIMPAWSAKTGAPPLGWPDIDGMKYPNKWFKTSQDASIARTKEPNPLSEDTLRSLQSTRTDLYLMPASDSAKRKRTSDQDDADPPPSQRMRSDNELFPLNRGLLSRDQWKESGFMRGVVVVPREAKPVSGSFFIDHATNRAPHRDELKMSTAYTPLPLTEALGFPLMWTAASVRDKMDAYNQLLTVLGGDPDPYYARDRYGAAMLVRVDKERKWLKPMHVEPLHVEILSVYLDTQLLDNAVFMDEDRVRPAKRSLRKDVDAFLTPAAFKKFWNIYINHKMERLKRLECPVKGVEGAAGTEEKEFEFHDFTWLRAF